MIRRSEWRRIQRDPTTPAGWCWDSLKSGGYRTLQTIAFVGPILLVLIAVGMSVATLVAIPVLIFLCEKVFRWTEIPTLTALTDLTPHPAPSPVFPIQFSIFVDGVCVGRDQGVALVVDGWLIVDGLHTEFSLRSTDLISMRSKFDGSDEIHLRNGQSIFFRAIRVPNSTPQRFGDVIRIWHRTLLHIPSGDTVFPPSTVHGSAIVRPVLGIAAGTLGISLLTAAFLLLRVDFVDVWPFLAAVSGLSVFVLYRSIIALARLQALDRQARLPLIG